MRIPLFPAILVLFLISARAEEALTYQQLQEQVRKLGDPDEVIRQKAQEKLAQAGEAALEVLKEGKDSTDPRIQSASAHLINLYQCGHDSINYRDVYPAGAFALRLKNLDAFRDGIQASPLGRLLANEKAAPLLTRLTQSFFDTFGMGGQKKLAAWANNVRAQVAFAIWNFDPGNDAHMRTALLIDLPREFQQKTYPELLKILYHGKNVVDAEAHKNVKMLDGPDSPFVTAQMGRHLILADDSQSVEDMIDGILAHDRRKQSNVYAAMEKSWQGDPDIVLEYDMVKGPLREFLRKLIPQFNGGVISYSMACQQGIHEERLIFGGAPIDAPAREPDGAWTHVIPAGACIAAGGTFDAGSILRHLSLTASALIKAKPFMDSQEPFNAQILQFAEMIQKTTESKEIVGMLESINGPWGAWMVPGADASKGPREVGVFISFDSAEKAHALAERLAAGGKDAVKTSYLRDWKLFELPRPEKAKGFPRAICWTVDNKSIYFTASMEALKSQLTRILEHAPQLSQNTRFIKAMSEFNKNDRGAQMLYADSEHFLPWLIGCDAQGASIDVETLTKLFKDFPPVIASWDRNGLNPVVRSPVPIVPLIVWFCLSGVRADPEMDLDN